VPQLRIRDLHPKEPLVLRRMETGTDLIDAFAECVASSTNHPDPVSEEEADLLASFVGNLHDWSELWDEVEPGDRVKASFQLGQHLDELQRAGSVVYIGVRESVSKEALAAQLHGQSVSYPFTGRTIPLSLIPLR
jgi:hypothetical protein